MTTLAWQSLACLSVSVHFPTWSAQFLTTGISREWDLTCPKLVRWILLYLLAQASDLWWDLVSTKTITIIHVQWTSAFKHNKPTWRKQQLLYQPPSLKFSRFLKFVLNYLHKNNAYHSSLHADIFMRKMKDRIHSRLYYGLNISSRFQMYYRFYRHKKINIKVKTTTTTTTVLHLRPFVRDYPGESVRER